MTALHALKATEAVALYPGDFGAHLHHDGALREAPHLYQVKDMVIAEE